MDYISPRLNIFSPLLNLFSLNFIFFLDNSINNEVQSQIKINTREKSEPMEVMLKKNKVKNKILESVSSRLRQIRHQG
jgi:hypothetical protein